ncbi:MAG: hypothetical protein ACI4B3_12775 [Prevotella sp.]
MMTNNDNNNELDVMRQQLEILKQKLNKQTIVNDRLIRKAMSRKMSWIMKYIWFELFFLLPFAALSFVFIKLMVPSVSWFPMIGILLLMLADILFDFYVNHTSAKDWLSENLVETGHRLVWMKRMRWWQVAVSLPIAVALFAWYFSGFTENEMLQSMIAGGIVGGVVGFGIGIYILIKMNRTNDELIQQIRDLTKEEI